MEQIQIFPTRLKLLTVRRVYLYKHPFLLLILWNSFSAELSLPGKTAGFDFNRETATTPLKPSFCCPCFGSTGLRQQKMTCGGFNMCVLLWLRWQTVKPPETNLHARAARQTTWSFRLMSSEGPEGLSIVFTRHKHLIYAAFTLISCGFRWTSSVKVEHHM